MRSLVTGGAGFIASHLIDRLVARGDEVLVLDNLSSGKKEFLSHHSSSVRLVNVDITNFDSVPGSEHTFHVLFASVCTMPQESDINRKA